MRVLKSIFFAFTLLLFVSSVFSQENGQGWLWSQRGGSPAALSSGNPLLWGRERVLDLAIDSDNNYYYLAEVSGNHFTLGGYDYNSGEYEFDTYNQSAGQRDIFIFSTNSSGNLRWSKTIGGHGYDFATSIGLDENDNVYVTGTVQNGTNSNTVVHFDTDSIMDPASVGPFTMSPSNVSVFIIKYNQNGDFQWLINPEGPSTLSSNGKMLKTLVDSDGTTRNLLWLGEGIYFNGQLQVAEGERQALIVIYNAEAELQDFILVDMTPLPGGASYYYQMAYDVNLNRYYIANCRLGHNYNILGINGFGSEENSFYLTALNNQGVVEWFHQDSHRTAYNLGDIQLDDSGNIYFAARMYTIIDSDYTGPPNSFAGYVFDPPGTGSGKDAPVLFKLDPDGNLLWGTNPDLYSSFPGQSIALRGNEVYLGLGMLHNTWGDITTPGSGGQGLVPDITIIRFDAQTGEPQELINDQHTLSADFINAIAIDQNGDLVVGGSFGSTLFYQTDLAIHNNGADADFFIAKYGLPPLGVKEHQKQTVKVYPNPAQDQLHIQSSQDLSSYKIYDLTGRLIRQDQLDTTEIDISTFEAGIYFLKITTVSGLVETIKVVKR